MLFSLLYAALRRVLGILVPARSDVGSAEVELLVHRHELQVLHRQVGRPRYRRRDRVLLTAASRLLPRSAWEAFSVTPQTILRWHRELVRRKWTFRRRGEPGGPIGYDLRRLRRFRDVCEESWLGLCMPGNLRGVNFTSAWGVLDEGADWPELVHGGANRRGEAQ